MHGISGGISGGTLLAMTEMLGGKFTTGDPLIMPPNPFTSVPVGIPPAEIATSTAIVVGVITHFARAMVFGLVFVRDVVAFPSTDRRLGLWKRSLAHQFLWYRPGD